MIKLSKPSKMPCLSWSLQALDTCPGSKDSAGGLVDACRGCYATDGNYRFKNVIAPRLSNREDWKREAWVTEMVKALDNSRYFRWFDSGDVYDVRLADKIQQVMVLTPWVKHWLPTRMYKFRKFHDVFARMSVLPNVVVRYSSDSIKGAVVAGKNSSTIVPTPSEKPAGASLCEAGEREGKCGPCRQCWDKNIKVIAYPQHGRKMAKVNKIKLLEVI